jgi:hypothetical protein
MLGVMVFRTNVARKVLRSELGFFGMGTANEGRSGGLMKTALTTISRSAEGALYLSPVRKGGVIGEK